MEELAFQRSLRRCEKNTYGAVSHLLVVMGMLGAAVTTTLVFLSGAEAGPPPLLSPIRALGNISGGMMLLSFVSAAALTGLLTEVFRLVGYAFYSVHLVVVALMLITAPYSKLVYAFYRMVASWVVKVNGWRGTERVTSIAS